MHNYKIKIGIITLVLAILSSLFWLGVKAWVTQSIVFSSVDFWIQPLVLLIFVVSNLALLFIVARSTFSSLVGSLIIALSFLIIFGLSPLLILASIIMMLFHLNALFNIRSEIEGRTKVSPYTYNRVGVWSIIIPILIMISFGYYDALIIKSSKGEYKLPVEVTNVVNKASAGAVKYLASDVPANEKNNISNQVVQSITKIISPYTRFAPPLLAFGLFLLLQGLSFVLIWFAILIGFILFRIFEATGLLKKAEKDVRAETIIF